MGNIFWLVENQDGPQQEAEIADWPVNIIRQNHLSVKRCAANRAKSVWWGILHSLQFK